jgi:hypothetical protein
MKSLPAKAAKSGKRSLSSPNASRLIEFESILRSQKVLSKFVESKYVVLEVMNSFQMKFVP